MKTRTKVVSLIAVLVLGAGCTLSSVLSEVSSDVAKLSPLLGIAETAGCLASPSLCPVLQVAVEQASPEAAQVVALTSAWSTASADAQPGKLNQLIAAVTTLQAQMKNGFAIPGLSSQTNGIIQGEDNLVAEVLTLLKSTLQNGGTTTAMLDLLNTATPDDGSCLVGVCYGGPPSGSLMASWTPLAVAHRLHTPRKYRLKNGAEIYTWAYHKGVMIVACQKKTGNPAWDKKYAALIEQIKKL